MRSLLEKAIVHLLNGDDEKASVLFHKFMVERARQIHESLRQDESAEDDLDENWDSEIKEEEYFDDNELGDDSTEAPTMDGSDSPIDGNEVDGDDTSSDPMASGDDGAMGGDDADPMADPDGGDSEPGVEGKIDDLTDKIDQLTAEFDRVMSKFHDDDDDDDDGGDIGVDDDDDMSDGDIGMGSDDDSAMVDDSDGADDEDNLAGRMEDDMVDDDDTSDDDHAHFESAKKPWKDKNKKDLVDEDVASNSDDESDADDAESDSDEDDINESDDLKDITESVLAELDKIAPVGNSEHQPVGSSAPKNTITSASGKNSPLPKHNVMDRVKGEPVMTKGPTHKGYAREEAPKVDSADNLVKNVRPENRRKSYSDTMKTVGPKGDESALINKDFTPGGPKPTKSIVDGKTTKG